MQTHARGSVCVYFSLEVISEEERKWGQGGALRNFNAICDVLFVKKIIERFETKRELFKFTMPSGESTNIYYIGLCTSVNVSNIS